MSKLFRVQFSLAMLIVFLIFCGGIGCSPASDASTDTTVTETEAEPDPTIGLILDTEQTFQGYTLFAPKHYHVTYLIDNQGNMVHFWDQSQYEPGQSVYLLENGNLLRACFMDNSSFTGGGEGGRIEEYDWDGNLVWEFDYSNDQHLSHHDIQPLPNGNILVLAVELKTYTQLMEAGFNPDMLREQKLYPDYIIEIQKVGTNNAEIVWEWHVWDHLIQDYDASKKNYGDVAAHPELVDVHGMDRPLPAFWNHMNAIDYNAQFDQIVVSVRGNSEFWIIDHGTTGSEAAGHTGGLRGKGGDLLYRWGNPRTYGAGGPADQTLFEQHDSQWITSACPGEGNILVYNNGCNRLAGQYSSVDEIVLPVDTFGNYTLPAAGEAFLPRQPLWVYTAANPTDLYSEAISGAQRLPNGNTLICDGTHGVFLEVTSSGQTVWHYINPVVNTGPLTQGETPTLDVRGHSYNAVFKIRRYAQDYPAFAGRDLSPLEPIEL
ncbi:MAG: arylsulfotransferase (ASST) [bacterium]|nr:arylsulfotransferase (ASST) [bacterium]